MNPEASNNADSSLILPSCGELESSLILPSCGELERSLSQAIQNHYRQLLGHLPKKVICHLFGRELVIILQSSATQVERFLSQEGRSELLFQVRQTIDQQLKQSVAQVIEAILAVDVKDIMVDTSLSLEQTGVIAILSKTPAVRNPDHIPKTPAYRKTAKQKVR